MTEDISKYFDGAKSAIRSLQMVDEKTIDKILYAIADSSERNAYKITGANYEDLIRMYPKDPKSDRLMPDIIRISGIAADIRNVALLNSPVGDVVEY